MEFSVWFSDNWFTILQSVGIVGSLWYAGRSFRWDAKVRRVGNLMQVVEGHRQIWSQLYAWPELARVREPDVNLERHPVTSLEEVFVGQIILHLSSVFLATKGKVVKEFEGLEIDVQSFFENPIPREVWMRRKKFQDQEFVCYVERILQMAERSKKNPR